MGGFLFRPGRLNSYACTGLDPINGQAVPSLVTESSLSQPGLPVEEDPLDSRLPSASDLIPLPSSGRDRPVPGQNVLNDYIQKNLGTDISPVCSVHVLILAL